MKNICLAYGVSFMDLEVDVPVGKVKIRKVYCLQDSGKIINPQLAEGQMHGGVAMGIGYALGEQMLFDAATGRPLNNNLLDYKIPTCMDIPNMEIRFVETHEDSAPLRSQGTGRAAPDSPGSGGSECNFARHRRGHAQASHEPAESGARVWRGGPDCAVKGAAYV